MRAVGGAPPPAFVDEDTAADTPVEIVVDEDDVAVVPTVATVPVSMLVSFSEAAIDPSCVGSATSIGVASTTSPLEVEAPDCDDMTTLKLLGAVVLLLIVASAKLRAERQLRRAKLEACGLWFALSSVETHKGRFLRRNKLA